MTHDVTGLEEIGPIDYIVVEFPADGMTGEAFPLLVDLVDRGVVRVLDMVVIRKDADGGVTVVPPDAAQHGAIGLAPFDGASSGLLDDDDVAEAAHAVEPGKAAVVLIYENLWAAPFASALRRGGAQLVASGRIPVQAILASLDATDPA